MKAIFLLSCLAAVSGCKPSQSQPNSDFETLPRYAGLQLQQDLELYKEEMETYHPGLFWYQSEAEWNRIFERVTAQLNYGADMITFYGLLNEINAQIGCGHTAVRLGRDYKDHWMDTARILPLEVKLINRQILVDRLLTADHTIPKGSEILRINGYTSTEIQQPMIDRIGMDGFNQTGKSYQAGRGFALRYLHFIDPFAESYELVYHTPGNSDEVTIHLEGIDYDVYEQKANQNPGDLLQLDPLAGLPGTWYMMIKTFSSSWMRSEGLNYFAFLETAFKNLKEENAQNLIIDLRGNGGGDDGNGSRLLSYLLDESFGYYRSIEVKPGYDGWGSPRRQDDGRFLITAHGDLQAHTPDPNPFLGNLYILIDGGSFSATSEFAALIHDHQSALFVGEETGGGYYGNSSGNRRRVTLPNTGIDVSIPYWKYLVDIEGSEHYGKGVPPTHHVVQSPEDMYNDRDTVLEFTKELIRQN